jgi:CheY-like chemotaxis protein
MKVILVDDNPGDRLVFAEVIEKLEIPMEVLYCRDSTELFHLLQMDNNVDLIWLDIHMPVKDGRECLKELKANKRSRHIPVIIYTGTFSEADIHSTFENGAHYYVVKPYAHINLTEALKTVFNQGWAQPPSREAFVINQAFM